MPDDFDDETLAGLKRSRLPWVLALFALLAGLFIVWLYGHEKQRGVTIEGQGHLVVLPQGSRWAWALLLNGTLVQLTPGSVARFHPTTGPCDWIEGTLEGERLRLEELRCAPGSLQSRIGERMHWMGLEYEWFDPEERFSGDTLEPVLETPEVIASMLDRRHPRWPQLVPLYQPLFPDALARARLRGTLPVPLIIEVGRNDLLLRRMTREDETAFLSRPRFHLAAGAAAGGWIVRTLVVDPAATGDLEDLLVDPTAPPWPDLLRQRTVRVARRTPLPEALAGAPAEMPNAKPKSNPALSRRPP